MIVYGDPSYEETAESLLARLRQRLDALLSAARPSPEAARMLLIEAGQFEQAVMDGLPKELPAEEARLLMLRAQAVTDDASTVFLARRRWGPPGSRGREVHPALRRIALALQTLGAPGSLRLTVKLPEGYAFYALYPEQYCLSAARWLHDHPASPPGRAVVIGIRSIGTSLSAVVQARLAAAGWEVHRLTARPTGHPFSRRVEISPEALRGARWALVVDEGPGLSGSSMAAVAEALARAGMDPDRISFLPGHGGEPGSAASESVRAWWSRARRYVTPLSDLRGNGRSLPQALAALTSDLCGGTPVERVEDFGGGLWRAALYADPGEWPAACAPFERPKYRCTLSDGNAVLWAFAGLAGMPGGAGSGAEAAFARLDARARAGWTPAPLGVGYGFVAVPWVEGVPLTCRESSPAVLAHVGRYLAAVAGPPLTRAEAEAALERLREMLDWNTREALGEEAAARVRTLSGALVATEGEDALSGYGDGRMAPHEWRRAPSGRLWKLDCAGHELDHTMVGRQPLLWDMAGALVEWGLTEHSAAPLLEAAREGGGRAVSLPALAFYRRAYAAFRLGQCTLCAQMSGHDPGEQDRLRRASAFYRAALSRLL